MLTFFFSLFRTKLIHFTRQQHRRGPRFSSFQQLKLLKTKRRKLHIHTAIRKWIDHQIEKSDKTDIYWNSTTTQPTSTSSSTTRRLLRPATEKIITAQPAGLVCAPLPAAPSPHWLPVLRSLKCQGECERPFLKPNEGDKNGLF